MELGVNKDGTIFCRIHVAVNFTINASNQNKNTFFNNILFLSSTEGILFFSRHAISNYISLNLVCMSCHLTPS
jgi:hypothetical protein